MEWITNEGTKRRREVRKGMGSEGERS